MITQIKLKELLDYDPGTGIFINKVTRTNNAKKGHVAGCLSKATGYLSVQLAQMLNDGLIEGIEL